MCRGSWFDEHSLQKPGRHVRRRQRLGIDYSVLLVCAYLLINRFLLYYSLVYIEAIIHLVIIKYSSALRLIESRILCLEMPVQIQLKKKKV